jgi:predicted lipoprotein with Yx(FWY)xxD motif
MRTSAFRTVRRAGVIAGLLALMLATVASATAGTSVGTHSTKRGKVLASVHGFSLYMFQKDKKGNGKSTCYGQCAKVWPPLLSTGRPRAMRGSGLNTRMLGTIRRTDGKTQVSYNGYPLYRWAGDSKPGDITGEGITQSGGKWYLLNTAGNIVKPKSGGGVCNPLCPGY